MSYHRPALARHAGDVLLGSAVDVATYTGRHPNHVRRHCLPIACDWLTRAPLYDLRSAASLLRDTPRRQRELTLQAS